MKKRILSMITALALAMALLPAAAGAGRTVQVSDSDTFNNAIKDLQDGDTIQLTNSFVVTTPTSSNDSLFIGKNVTIDGQGHGLSLRYAGVLLGADVTFQNVTLGLASNVRPAIMANGHTLTLDGVTRDPTNRNINLFCGGQTGVTQGDLAARSQGGHGHIIIKGNTYLGPTGRVFAGSISTDGTNNEFTGSATVTIDPSVSGDPIGELYACGALQTYTSENDWFDYEHEINPPFASPGNFKVRGNVTFNLYQGKVGKVSGDTGVGGNLAQVNYEGTDYLNDGLLLSSIGGLTVESGNLVPTAGELVQKNTDTADRTSEIVPVPGGSCFSSTNTAPLGVAANATLGLQRLGDVIVGNFTGGGSLVLGASQKLTVTGSVTGSTTVGIGGIFNGHSQTIPTVGSTYIDAAQSKADSFTLAAPASRPDIKLVDNGNGAWTAAADETVIVVSDFKIASAVVESSSGPNAELPVLAFTDIQATSENTKYPFASVRLTISVNNVEATVTDDGSSYTYSTSTLDLCVTEGDTSEEALTVAGTNNTYPPAGTYVISVTVPAANSGTGQPITRTATLTVKAAGGGDTPIPEPTANTGLVYTGQEQVGVPLNAAYTLSSGSAAAATNAGEYETKVTPATGFTWEGGGTEERTINWSIAKADNSSLPTGLAATAPTVYGASDGRITGTTAEMEYSTDAQFAAPVGTQCAATETTGLTAGGYYVRYKADDNHLAGTAVPVTVPQGPVTVQSVVISSTDHKTSYQTGEALDVTGLTLAVTMSDGSRYLVPVAAGMVTGFDSSSAASQTLTVTYGGKTTTYTISISENTGTDPIAVSGVTLNKSALALSVGSSERLTAAVSPDNAANKAVTWASQNTAVATVDAVGTVAAVGAGTAVITVTTADGGKTASCTVTVSPAGGGSTGGGSTGGGSTGGGSTGGGSTGGGSTGGPTGGGTSTEITRNPDGSTTTTVTNKATGTVTETTRNTDGSTTVVESRRDGTVTTTDTARNGVKVVTVSKPGADTSARVTLPASVQTATVTLPGQATPGTVAVDARTGKLVMLSAPTEDGVVVRLDVSAELILEDRSRAFADTDGHWARSDIDFATAHALFNGTSDATFAPDEAMTRGMVAVVLHNLAANPDSAAGNSFTDVASGMWYADAINWITGQGITGGYGDGSFGADDHATREQLVTLLYRYAGAMGYSTQGAADLSAFPDRASVSPYAADAMRWAVGNGLILGTDGGALAPGDGATRAEAASILNRFVRCLTK